MGCPPVAELAAPHTLARLRAVLPPPPARLAEVGAGFGALAGALAAAGYAVTAVEPDPESAAACRARGLAVLQVPLEELPPGGYDAVLCTRMLHHVPDLLGAVRRAAAACAPGGPLVVEDFARDEVDRAGAAFVYDAQALLAAAGAVPAELLQVRADPLTDWRDVPPERLPIHPGRAVLGALAAVGATEVARTEMLWRLALGPAECTPDELAPVAGALREIELRRIADGTLPAIGILAVCRPTGAAARTPGLSAWA